VVVNGTVSVSENTGGLISETTGELGPKRVCRKSHVDQKGSWPSMSRKGPTSDPEEVIANSLEEFSHLKGR
jgi:hypothetical protein